VFPGQVIGVSFCKVHHFIEQKQIIARKIPVSVLSG
jgi:hypothetical protein